ncbi:MAG: hypothetical protein JOZ72_00595 [Alphaproteobacteria bacterium]|nr:hypothetical protein [Alphaproteobacteria bacterium]
MSVLKDDDVPALATTAPSPVEKRDLLGSFCFYFHFAVMIFIVAGWALPWAPALWFYLGFLPLVALHWQFNRNSCVLNNIESLIRYGTWRSQQNAEEGAWLMTLIKNVTGVALKAWQTDLLTYAVMATLWSVGLAHLKGWW